MCALLTWREGILEEKKSSVTTGKIIIRRKNILLFIMGNFSREFIYSHNLGIYLVNKWSRNFTGGNLFNIIIGELMFLKKNWGVGDYTVDRGSCTDNVFLFSSPIT